MIIANIRLIKYNNIKFRYNFAVDMRTDRIQGGSYFHSTLNSVVCRLSLGKHLPNRSRETENFYVIRKSVYSF